MCVYIYSQKLLFLCPNKEIPCSGALPVSSSVYHHILERFQTTLNNKNSEYEQHNPD